MTVHAIALVSAELAAFSSLAWRGLGREYPALMTYLAASVVRSFSLGWFDPRTSIYLDLWLWTLPAVIALQVLVGAECYRKAFSEVPGLVSYMHVPIMAICLIAAAGALFAGDHPSTSQMMWRAYRAVAMTLFTACLGAGVMVRILRPWRRRNLVLHERVLGVHFFTIALLTIFPAHGSLNGVVSIACCAAWALLLTQEGEKGKRPSTPSSGGSANPELELDQIRAGLSSILR